MYYAFSNIFHASANVPKTNDFHTLSLFFFHALFYMRKIRIEKDIYPIISDVKETCIGTIVEIILETFDDNNNFVKLDLFEIL